MTHPALLRFDALVDAFYRVSPERRKALTAKARVAVGRHLPADHQTLRDFDAASPRWRPEALANVAKVHGVTPLRPWEWITHLCRSVDVFEFMLMYWLTLQRWVPRVAYKWLCIGLALVARQWRIDAAYNEAVSRGRVLLPACLVPFAVAHQGANVLAVNVNRGGAGWTRIGWWQHWPTGEPDASPPVPWFRFALVALFAWNLLGPPAEAGVSLAALGAAGVWEVRTTGAATNGGGFVTGSSGTDWSQQDAAQYSVTDGVTAGTTTITSATASFGADVVGNFIYVAGGTGAVVGDWYQIITRTNATTIVVDRSTGLTAGTGVTLKIGGAHSDPAIVAGKLVAGHTIYQKAGTYTITSTTANVAGGRVSTGVAVTRWEGYQVSRGDIGTKPLMQASGVSTTTLFSVTSGAGTLVNLSVDGASLTSIRGFDCPSGAGAAASLCAALNCTNGGFGSNMLGLTTLYRCLTSGCATVAAFDSRGAHFACVASTNTVTGFSCANALAKFTWCLSVGNTGASSDGFDGTSSVYWCNCVAYGNGRDGFREMTGQVALTAINCIAEANGGYGFRFQFSSINSTHFRLNCATYNNTSGAVLGTLQLEEGNVTGSASFFVDAANGDFRLNTTAGGGALARAAGIPGVFPGGLTTGYLDIGAVQHADPAGGGGIPIIGGSIIRTVHP